MTIQIKLHNNKHKMQIQRKQITPRRQLLNPQKASECTSPSMVKVSINKPQSIKISNTIHTQPNNPHLFPNSLAQENRPINQHQALLEPHNYYTSRSKLQRLMKSRIQELKEKCLVMNAYGPVIESNSRSFGLQDGPHTDLHMDPNSAHISISTNTNNGNNSSANIKLKRNGKKRYSGIEQSSLTDKCNISDSIDISLNKSQKNCEQTNNNATSIENIKNQIHFNRDNTFLSPKERNSINIKYSNMQGRSGIFEHLQQTCDKPKYKQRKIGLLKQLFQQKQQETVKNSIQQKFQSSHLFEQLQRQRQKQKLYQYQPTIAQTQISRKLRKKSHKTWDNLETIDAMKQKISKTLVKDLLSLQSIQQTLLIPKSQKNTIKIKLFPAKKKNLTINYSQCRQLAQSKEEQLIGNLKKNLDKNRCMHDKNNYSFKSERVKESTPKLQLLINQKYINKLSNSTNPLMYFLKNKQYCQQQFQQTQPLSPKKLAMSHNKQRLHLNPSINNKYSVVVNQHPHYEQDVVVVSEGRGHRSERKKLEEVQKIKREEFSPWEIRNQRYAELMGATDGFETKVG